MLKGTSANVHDPEPSETRDFISSPALDQSRQLQGQCRIQSYEEVKLWKLGAFLLLPLLALATCFVGLIIVLRSTRLKAWFLYSKCSTAQATHFLITGNDSTLDVAEVIDTHPIQIEYRKVKYFLWSKTFVVASYEYRESPGLGNPKYARQGLQREQQLEQRMRYGPCEHRVEIPTLLEYLFAEMTGPMFMLQYFICIIYIAELFYFFAAAVIGTSVITTIINYFLLRSSLKKIKEIAERITQVRVIRAGCEEVIDSDKLVPGDVLLLNESDALPCDCILIDGELYLNEASLTGESVPIQKLPPTTPSQYKNDKCWLYEGSTVVESRGAPAALVVHTGFITRKGRIIRKILHRTEPRPEFFRHGLYFLLELLFYGFVVYFATLPMLIAHKIAPKLIVLRFFDMVGWIIPPTFPIYFNLCYSFALYRLKKEDIYGTEPLKTITAGKVKTVCFDKTGTLTENHMKLHLIVLANGQRVPAEEWKGREHNDPILTLFACCHTVRSIRGEFQGDQLDLRMFEFSQFEYIRSENERCKLIVRKGPTVMEILRINQFESKFQGMSVLVRNAQTNECFVMVKGAPEKMKDISCDNARSFAEYDSTVSNLSLAGLRSLAFGAKRVPADYEQLLTMDRSDFERGVQLLGLVGFQNKLKTDTLQTILLLNRAHVETKIITGDNIYIGVETAVRAGFLASNSRVIVLQGSSQIPLSDTYNGQMLSLNRELMSSAPVRMNLQQLIDTKVPVAIDNSFLALNESIVPYAKVFARISPENKAKIIALHQQTISHEFDSRSATQQLFGPAPAKVAMVGDGANDILAIRQADVGVGMSQTDSSFAASFSVGHVLDVEAVLRYGRSTLTIIIEIFRYYVAISYLKYTASTILAVDRSSYGDGQFTYFNYLETLEIVILLCLSPPALELSRFLPDSNFMSLQNHLAVLGQIVISTLGVLTVFLVARSNVHFHSNPTNVQYTQWVFECHSNSVVFLSSQLFYIMMAVWLYISNPWKARVWMNIPLLIWLVLVLGVNVAFFWITPHLSKFIGLTDVGFMALVAFGFTLGFVALGGIWSEMVRIATRQKDDQ